MSHPVAKRILMVKLSAIGDVVQTLPALHDLRAQYPEAHIAWLVEKKAVDIIRDHESLNEVIVFDRARKNVWEVVCALRRGHYDWAIDFQGTYKSGFFMWASGVKRRSGYKTTTEPCSWAYNDKVPLRTWDVHAAARQRELIAALGVDNSLSLRFDIAISAQDRHVVDEWLHKHGVSGAFMVLSAVCSRPANFWGITSFQALVARITQELKVPVLLIGTAQDRSVNETVGQGCPLVKNMAGETTLKQTAELLSRAQLMVAGDTGPLHLAVAMGTPVVGIYGPTDPRRTGPWRGVVVRHFVECQPCLKKICPLQHHACLKDLSVEKVYEQIRHEWETHVCSN